MVGGGGGEKQDVLFVDIWIWKVYKLKENVHAACLGTRSDLCKEVAKN